jgi:hypothetical protein
MMQHNHQEDENCAECKHGPEYVHAQTDSALARHGWFIHMVTGDSQTRTGANSHTHGLESKYKHPDLQIVVPLEGKLVSNFFWNIVNRIAAGEKFKAGDEVAEIIGGSYKVRFIDAQESGRPVLRVILPDKHGSLDKNRMTGKLDLQYD